MLTRLEDENAIDLSSIVLPDHVLRALISIDLSVSLARSLRVLAAPDQRNNRTREMDRRISRRVCFGTVSLKSIEPRRVT